MRRLYAYRNLKTPCRSWENKKENRPKEVFLGS